MKYAILENGALKFAPLNYINENGELIVNFTNSITLMKKYGYKPVVYNPPEYDETKQVAVITGYEIDEVNDCINALYGLADIVDDSQSIENRVKSIENRVTTLEEAYSYQQELLTNKVNNM